MAFYIEGSGGYTISNIDLVSHEIYFTKQDVMAHFGTHHLLLLPDGIPRVGRTAQPELDGSGGNLEQKVSHFSDGGSIGPVK